MPIILITIVILFCGCVAIRPFRLGKLTINMAGGSILDFINYFGLFEKRPGDNTNCLLYNSFSFVSGFKLTLGITTDIMET